MVGQGHTSSNGTYFQKRTRPFDKDAKKHEASANKHLADVVKHVTKEMEKDPGLKRYLRGLL